VPVNQTQTHDYWGSSSSVASSSSVSSCCLSRLPDAPPRRHRHPIRGTLAWAACFTFGTGTGASSFLLVFILVEAVGPKCREFDEFAQLLLELRERLVVPVGARSTLPP
jgi:hypothetical protein